MSKGWSKVDYTLTQKINNMEENLLLAKTLILEYVSPNNNSLKD